jgi:hypothetical protein
MKRKNTAQGVSLLHFPWPFINAISLIPFLDALLREAHEV